MSFVRSASFNQSPFPLSLDSSGRYLKTANGTPFLLIGDTPSSIEVQLTNAQIDTYLNDRQARGINAIWFELMEHEFSSQTPAYDNADGVAPLTTMTDYSSALVAAYWNRVDYIINSCKARGIVCFVFPAYWGFDATSEGWHTEVNAASTGALQTYGSTLAARYTQGNVVWIMGGDSTGTGTADRSQQWNVITGIQSVRRGDLICAHPSRSNDAYALWGPAGDNQNGWNLGTVYCQNDGSDAYSLSATAYGRNPAVPFFELEDGYEGASPNTGGVITGFLTSKYQTILSGGFGAFMGNIPTWGFGEPNFNGGLGPANALATGLDTPGAHAMSYLKGLFSAYQWWKLVPKTDTSVVTSALGSGASRICPAITSDNKVAMIWNPSASAVTVNMAAMTGVSSIRARFYDPTTGIYTAASGSPFAVSGTQSITWPGLAVLVLDQQ